MRILSVLVFVVVRMRYDKGAARSVNNPSALATLFHGLKPTDHRFYAGANLFVFL